MNSNQSGLKLKQLGIDTYKEAVIYIREDSQVRRSEGFEVHARIKVMAKNRHILATLNTIQTDLLLPGEASLSKYAWELLQANEGDEIKLSHPKPLQSLSFIRSKIYGNSFHSCELQHIIKDISDGRYSDIHIATFLTACAGGKLDNDEIIELTRSMINVGEKLSWSSHMVVDKHCVGGLPGNRTTPIVVPIVTAFGLMMPKTSSRAITSPAGTSHSMEVLAPVDLSYAKIRQVVEQENGCIAWGGSVALSPADDILLQVERAMDLDSEGQLIASVLSKKIAAGSTHILIDIPFGPTAKLRSLEHAKKLSYLFSIVGDTFGISIKFLLTDGSQPVGRGIGPALEARDILDVLQCVESAPKDLRERALTIAGAIIEFSTTVNPGEGKQIATKLLDDGTAWKKFQAICAAQGGIREPKKAAYTHAITAKQRGRVISIDNRQLSRVAKLAGAPHDKAAGVVLHTPIDTLVEKNTPLFTIHADSKGELNYALSLLKETHAIIQVEACE